jgi:hypothetical protein
VVYFLNIKSQCYEVFLASITVCSFFLRMRRGRSDALYLSSRSSLTDAESISVKKCTIEFSTKVYIAMCFDVND